MDTSLRRCNSGLKQCLVTLPFLFLALLWSSQSAAKFEATLDRNRVTLGDSIQLSLTLSDENSDEEPDLNELHKEFNILSQGTQSSIQIINGNFKRTMGWNIRLEPRREGKLIIPIISIKTSNGVATTEPIQVQVGPASELPTAAADNRVELEVSVSDDHPYQQQSILYTVKILSQSNLIQPELTEPKVEGAVLEEIGQPQQRTEIRNGRRVSITTLTYALTPLQAGTLTIGPSHLKTQLAQRGSNSLFFPFGGPEYKSYLLASKSLTLEVKKPVPGVSPWLPLHSLHLEEQWQLPDRLLVGEPLSRTLTLVADGTQGLQLPDLKPADHPGFRLYSEHPEYENGLSPGNNHLSGKRKETHTLIPLQAGDLNVPSVRIAWWDVDEDKLKYAETPPRSLKVLPNPQQPAAAPPAIDPLQQSAKNEQQPVIDSQPTEVHTLSSLAAAGFFLAGLGSALLVVFLAKFFMRKSPTRDASRADKKSENNAEYSNKQLSRMLSQSRTASEIEHLLKAFAASRYQLTAWSSKNFVTAAASVSPRLKTGPLRELLEKLDRSLYAGGELDTNQWINEFNNLVSDFGQIDRAKNKARQQPLPPLNPG